MKDISEMVDTAKGELYDLKGSKIAQVEQSAFQSEDFINKVFKSLQMVFPAWRNSIRDDSELAQIKKMWLRTFIDEKITSQEEISRGLKGARNHDSPFFPSIGQFIKWTKPVATEKPRVNEQAYQLYVPKMAKHTQDEYNEMGERGIDKIKNIHSVVSNREDREQKGPSSEEKHQNDSGQPLQSKIENAAMVANRWGTPMDDAQRCMGMTEQEIEDFKRY